MPFAFLRTCLTPARLGAAILLLVALPCLLALPWAGQPRVYNDQQLEVRQPPGWVAKAGGDSASAADSPGKTAAPASVVKKLEPFGSDNLGRSLLARCLLGGVISLGLGLAASAVAVAIGVSWGALAGYAGGRVDAFMMRVVDVLYGLPYILIVVMISVAVMGYKDRAEALVAKAKAAGTLSFDLKVLDYIGQHPLALNLATLVVAIGCVSWLTMARVIRGQVLSLRAQPFIESARAVGCGPARIFCRHLLPNCLGPIIVYATLAVPTAILEEAFLSFLGIGVQAPLPSWGGLAADGVGELAALREPGMQVGWWLLLFPCLLLGLTLLALNFLGDALREKWDPRRVS